MYISSGSVHIDVWLMDIYCSFLLLHCIMICITEYTTCLTPFVNYFNTTYLLVNEILSPQVRMAANLMEIDHFVS